MNKSNSKTETELENLHQELDWFDRQDALENISEIVRNRKATDSKELTLAKLVEIGNICWKFIG